jgi:hypothetical protein
MYGYNDYFLNRFGRICQLSTPYIFSLVDPEVLMQPLYVIELENTEVCIGR